MNAVTVRVVYLMTAVSIHIVFLMNAVSIKYTIVYFMNIFYTWFHMILNNMTSLCSFCSTYKGTIQVRQLAVV